MAKNKVFLDSSVLITAVLSQWGGSFYILNTFCNDGRFEFQTNDYVFDEVCEVLERKFSADENLKSKLFLLIGLTPIKILNDPPKLKMDAASRIVNKKDAPILASAFMHSDYLLTLDNDFLTNTIIKFAQKKNVTILKPKEFIEKFRK